jgi:hypothetical protein
MVDKKVKAPSGGEFIEARRNAEAYFQDTKNRGKILVNAGRLSKEDYYKKIRKVGIETGVISPDEFPGGAPEWLEPALEIGLGITGYVVGAAQGLRKGAPLAGGAAGYGAGAGLGQASFDAINKLTADEGQVVKPNNVILKDALQQAGIDAGLSYGIDKVVLPGLGKTFQVAKNVSIGAKNKAVKGLQAFRNRLSPEEQKKFVDKFGKGKTSETEIGKSYAKSKEESQSIINANRAQLESEGLTPTRYQVLSGSGTIGQVLRGASDASQIIPGASFYGKKSYQNTVDDTLASLQNPIISGSNKNLNDRAAFASGNAFIKDIKGDYVRNPAKLEAIEKSYESLPITAYSNLIKISDDNIARYRKDYKEFDTGLKETKTKFTTDLIQEDIVKFNTLLKSALGEKETVAFSKELPSMMRKIISPTKTPAKFKFGVDAGKVPETITPPLSELSGKDILLFKTQLRELRNNRKVFETREAGLSSSEKLLASALSKIEGNVVKSIETKQPELAAKFTRANSIFKENNQFLADNEGLLAFGKTLDGKDYNPFVYDGFKDEFRELTGTEFKTILGRGLGKEITAQQVVKDFLTKPEGIGKLKNIMNKSAKIKMAERKKEAIKQGLKFEEKNIQIQVIEPIVKNGKIIEQKVVTKKVSEVEKADQEFGELLINEIEDTFDSTLLLGLRESGSFNPDSFLRKIGASYSEGALSKKRYYKELIKQAQKTTDVATGGKFLENITYDRLVSFGKMFKGFQDEPGVSKFLLRRAPLALSSGVTLSKVLPIAGAGAGGALLGVGGFIATMGIINLFNKFISQPLGKSYWQSVKGDKNKLGEFLKAIYSDVIGQDAIRYQFQVSNLLRQLPRGLAVGALQPDAAPRTREQYYNPGLER